MKKLIVILSIFLITTISYGQLGNLNKIKNKAKNKVKNKTETQKTKSIPKKGTIIEKSNNSSSSSTLNQSSNDTPKYSSDDPIYNAYSKVKENVKYTNSTFESIEWKSNITGSNERAIKYLEIVKEKMTFLKENGEDSKNYYNEFEKEYTKLETFRATEVENYEIDKIYEKKMEQYYYWAKLGRVIKDTSIIGSYEGYNTFKTDFATNRPEKFATSYMKKYSGAVDNYLAVEVYEEIPYYNEKVDRIIKKAHKITDRNVEAYKLSAKTFVRNFEDALIEISYLDEFLLEDKVEINKVKAKIDKDKSMLDNYISSGEYDTYVAKFRQELIDAVRLRPNALNNDIYRTMAIKGVTKGTGKKANIASSRWLISRTDFGYPKYKYLPVDLAVSFEGKCYLAYGQLVQDYQGGGVYGKVYFDYGSFQEEMNCNNANK